MPDMLGLEEREVTIPAGEVELKGDLRLPPGARALVLFAHGSGSSRKSPRNRLVAAALNEAGIATLLLDLLTVGEEQEDLYTGHLRFDIPLLAGRLAAATEALRGRSDTRDLALGYFGASTGAAAALLAAARQPEAVKAVVSRGGRPDLAGPVLEHVVAPTLLIVGERDEEVLELNREAYSALRCEKQLEVVPFATHLFEEPGTLEAVARLAARWFLDHLEPEPIALPGPTAQG